jgi:hypothetical protein
VLFFLSLRSRQQSGEAISLFKRKTRILSLQESVIARICHCEAIVPQQRDGEAISLFKRKTRILSLQEFVIARICHCEAIFLHAEAISHAGAKRDCFAVNLLAVTTIK